MAPEVVVDGIRFGEGPVWRPATNDLVCTSVCDGLLWRIDVTAGSKQVLADTGGGANGAALCADNGLLVTQNGGIDFTGLPPGLLSAPLPRRDATPGLRRVGPDGEVSYLADDGFHAPNDLAVAGDGTVYFTDPGHYPPPDPPIGRVLAYRDGTVSVVASDFWFCNGIALTADGALVVIERRGLQRIEPDGSRTWVVEKVGTGGGDGFCLDAQGRYYVCATIEHGVRIVDTDGTLLDFLPIGGKGVTTNCCFGGPEHRTLFATDSIPGQVVAWENMPTPGLPLPVWPGPGPAPAPGGAR
jgi:gluconolactonase